MKLKGLFTPILHCNPGYHEQFNHWYDTDHIPENRALPGIFHAQRYYAPRRYREARDPLATDMVRHQGGEYLTLYYVDGDLTSTYQAFRDLAQRLRGEGRMFQEMQGVLSSGQPFTFERVWVHKGVRLVPDAIPTAPHYGVYMILGEITDPAREKEFLQWEDETHIPSLLEGPEILAVFLFRSHNIAPGDRLLFLCYLDQDPPVSLGTPAHSPEGPQRHVERAFRRYMSSAYRSITPLRYDFIEE
jgi:hypothetical protein